MFWARWAGNIAWLVVCICGLIAEGLSAATVPAGFTETVIPGPSGGGWNEAVGLTFENNGRMYVWERSGRIWFKDPGNAAFSLILNISEEVGDWGDHGCLGFALDPNFRVNGYIYLLYVVDRYYLLNFGRPGYKPSSNEYNAATIGRLTRYTCRASDGFRSVDPASRLILIGETKQTGFPMCSDTHGVGSLVFGEDGTLLVSCGDGASPYGADLGGTWTGSYAPQALADGILRLKEDVGSFRAQLVDCLNGKVLRINPANGNGLSSNPFYDAANPRSARSRVWAMGLRNPFRMSLRPESGSHNPADGNPGVLYVGDVGWETWECLKVVTGPRKNFGWPIFEGLDRQVYYGPLASTVFNLDAANPLYPASGCNQYFSFDDLFNEVTLDPASQPPFVNPCNTSQRIPSSIPQFLHTRPVLDWNHASAITRTPIYGSSGQAQTANVGSLSSPVSGTQFKGDCVIGGTWYTGTNFPAQYQNRYYFADWGQGLIKTLTFDQNDKPVALAGFTSAAGAVVSVVQHPINGSLYYISYDFNNAAVKQLSYTGNRTPIAVASADKYYGATPLAVQCSGSGSIDPDGQTITYLWNFGDGSAVSTLVNPSHTFSAPVGVPTKFVVTLTVKDGGGLSARTTLIVAVNDTPPNATITSPVNGALYSPSSPTSVNLTATVSDTESTDSQLLYQWQTLLPHNDHNHLIGLDTHHVTSTVLSPIGCDGVNIYFYRIILTVTDSTGLLTVREARLYPDCGRPPGGTNLFTPVAGTFNGLFFDANDVQNSSSGCFSLTMTAAGTYKGTIQNKGKRYALKGAFDANGQAVNTIPRAGASPLTVNWQGNLSDSNYLSGTVSDGTAVAQLGGGRDVFDTGNPAPQAGQYTLIIPGIDGATLSPAGSGCGTVIVGADGMVRFKGRLADDTVAVQKVALSKNGEWPVCISLYQGQGILIGWLQFGDDGANDISGTLRWTKPNLPTSRLYKPGFSVNSEVIGSHYAAPTGTAKMLQITDGVVVLSEGNLPDSSNPVTFDPGSKLVNNGPNALKLTFTPASGLFSGAFQEAATTRIFLIKGAVLQRQNNGSGYAPGADQSGQVIFRAAP